MSNTGKSDLRQEAINLLNHIDIVDVIGSVIPLYKKGNQIVGQCPFHDDRDPSLDVSQDKQVYKCWVCDAGLNGSQGGDAITFVRKYYGLPFSEAMTLLKEKAGLSDAATTQKSAPKKSFHPLEEAQKKAHDSMPALVEGHLKALDWFCKNYESALNSYTSENKALDYLTKERSLNIEQLKKMGFYFGFAPENSIFSNYGPNHLLPYAKELGLVREYENTHENKRIDLLRDRVVFGIRNITGNIVGFGARVIPNATKEEQKLINNIDDILASLSELSSNSQSANTKKQKRPGKYINSPQSPVFDKSHELFGFYENRAGIKQTRQCLIVEGYLDVLALANHGLDCAVSPMGVALSQAQVKNIYDAADTIVLCFDGDTAGQKAQLKALQAAAPYLNFNKNLKILTLPDNLDPDSYINQFGLDKFCLNIDCDAIDAKRWFSAYLLKNKGAGEKEQSYFANRVKQLIESINDPLERNEWALLAKRAAIPITFDDSDANSEKAQNAYIQKQWAGICQAAKDAPREAAAIRADLINIINSHPNEQSSLVSFVARFDQNMQAGFALPDERANLSPSFIKRQERLLALAPKALEQLASFTQNKLKQRLLATQYKDGEIDDIEYLERLRSKKKAMR